MISHMMVLGHRVNIRYQPPPKHDDDKLLGMFDGDQMTIWVDPDLSEDAKRVCLFHELIHAALWISGTGFLLSENQEEAIVRALESALHPILKKHTKELIK